MHQIYFLLVFLLLLLLFFWLNTYLDVKLSVLCYGLHKMTNTVWNGWRSTKMRIRWRKEHSIAAAKWINRMRNDNEKIVEKGKWNDREREKKTSIELKNLQWAPTFLNKISQTRWLNIWTKRSQHALQHSFTKFSFTSKTIHRFVPDFVAIVAAVGVLVLVVFVFCSFVQS